MAVSYYQQHRPREASITVSLSPDFSGDYVAPGVADDVTINAAIIEMVAFGGGEVVLGHGNWALIATVNVPANVFLRGMGWETVLNYDAGGNCITITGGNVKIRDLKIVIVAGAGGAGTRPNCILADTRDNLEVTKVWLVGDSTVGDDGSDIRQCGVCFSIVTFSKLSLCRSENNRRHGIFFISSLDNAVTGCTCNGNSQHGIVLDSSLDSAVTGCTCNGNTGSGIRFVTGSNNAVTGCTCNGNSQHGIFFISSLDNAVTGCTCNGNSQHGIFFSTGSDNAVTGCTCNGNTQHGMIVDDSDNNSIVANEFNENDSGDTGSFDGINITDTSSDNLVHSNTCNDNDRYGINIDDVLALRNWVKNNQLRGNTSGPFNDNIANLTKLATIPIQLIQGTTFISTANEAWGWEIDLATEFALGIGWLPLEVQQVVRIRVIGVGLAAPGAGNFMRIQITGEGATFDEVFTTEPIDVVDHNNEEVNFAIDDVINWVFDATDDADIGQLLGGDRLQIKVLHEGAGGSDIATDAIVDSIQVEYV